MHLQHRLVDEVGVRPVPGAGARGRQPVPHVAAELVHRHPGVVSATTISDLVERQLRDRRVVAASRSDLNGSFSFHFGLRGDHPFTRSRRT